MKRCRYRLIAASRQYISSPDDACAFRGGTSGGTMTLRRHQEERTHAYLVYKQILRSPGSARPGVQSTDYLARLGEYRRQRVRGVCKYPGGSAPTEAVETKLSAARFGERDQEQHGHAVIRGARLRSDLQPLEPP